MKIPLIQQKLRSTRRLAEILKVLSKFGFREIIIDLGFDTWLPGIKKEDQPGPPAQATTLSRPVRMRMVFEELGPTFIKLGQLLSTRPDLVPPDWAEELATQVEALNASLPDADPWHTVDPEIRPQLLASLRENASNLQELRAILPLFTEEETSFTSKALTELAASLPVLRALDQAMSSHDPKSRLHKEAINVVLRQAGEQAFVKGRQLYHPVRLALTGSDSGPELTTLLTLLPAGLIRQRIQTVLNIFSHSNHKE